MAARTADALDALLAHGRHVVTTQEAAHLLGVPAGHVRVRMNRYAHSGRVFSPARGLWVLVPPEFRTWAVTPGLHFIDAMMGHLGRDYYVGWLSAAEIHGSAHQRPQVLQVAVDAHLADRDVGRVRLRFAERRRVGTVPRLRRNVPTGQVWVSTPAATMLDLADDVPRGGGVSNVATLLLELTEEIDLDPQELAQTAAQFPLSAIRRLGYLLDLMEQHESAEPLHVLSEQRRYFQVDALAASAPRSGNVDPRWRVDVNTDVEPDL